MILCDPAAERAILAGICTYGEDAYLDIADILQESSFTVDSNTISSTRLGCFSYSFQKRRNSTS
jgi:hypothetical protein